MREQVRLLDSLLSGASKPCRRATLRVRTVAILLALASAGCSSPSSDTVAYRGLLEACQSDLGGFGNSDCACVASAYQANVDPDLFAVLGRYHALKGKGLIYSDASPAGDGASSQIFADMNRHLKAVAQKEAAGRIRSNLTRLAEDFKSCGGVFAESGSDIAAGFTGANMLHSFLGAR